MQHHETELECCSRVRLLHTVLVLQALQVCSVAMQRGNTVKLMLDYVYVGFDNHKTLTCRNEDC